MAHEESNIPETLDSSSNHSETNQFVQVSLSSSDPSLLRNVSFSKLNAKAPEFVPSPRARSVIPPPPPPAVVHMYPGHGGGGGGGGGGHHFIPIQMPNLSMHHSHVHHGQFHHGHHGHHSNQHHHSSTSGNNTNSNSKQYHGEQEASVGVGITQQDGRQADRAKNGEESSMKILNQVEYYFSDLNLATTDHLMKFINKDPEGYVPINVVAAFKKIKALICSHSQLAAILRNSTKLVVSDDGKKVKRQHPLTEANMEELQSRIVVAENLPEDHCHQNLMKVFSAIGSVKTIRTCQPQPTNGGPSSTSRSAKADAMSFSNKLHAFVEYESVELAEKAVAELNDEGNWRSGLRVRLFRRTAGLVNPQTKPTHSRGKKAHDGEGNCEEDETGTSELQSTDKEEPSHQSHAQSHEHTGEEHVSEREGGRKKGHGRNRAKGRGRGQPHQSNRGNHVGSSTANAMISNEQSSVLTKQPPGPRMPDGTRGFSMGRGKPIAVSNSQ